MNEFYKLDYTHEFLEALLKKLELGCMLSEEQYNQLIETIGLDNISVFSGSYEDLIDKPNINHILSEEILIAKQELEAQIIKTKEELENINNLLAQKENEFRELFAAKDFVEKLADELEVRCTNTKKDILLYTDLELDNIKGDIKKKTDIGHYHTVEDIDLLSEALDSKSNVDHMHETEHTHDNKGILDAITNEKYQYWNRKADFDEIPIRVSELVNDMDYVDVDYIKSYIITTVDELNLDTYTLKTDFDIGMKLKSDIEHTHDPKQVRELDALLDDKVDKEVGKSLVDDELIKVIKTLKSLVTKTNGRPSEGNVIIGQYYFDATLGFPIWWNGVAWTNADGRIV